MLHGTFCGRPRTYSAIISIPKTFQIPPFQSWCHHFKDILPNRAGPCRAAVRACAPLPAAVTKGVRRQVYCVLLCHISAAARGAARPARRGRDSAPADFRKSSLHHWVIWYSCTQVNRALYGAKLLSPKGKTLLLTGSLMMGLLWMG